jgi:tRNA(fMet)-specific endonuclease VapC
LSTLLLDTDVFSYLFKGHPLAGVYRPILQGHIVAISFMTVAELFHGAYRAVWGEAQLDRLEAQIKTYLVIPSNDGMCKTWGEVRSIRRHQPISTEDAWIAATALAYDCALVTNNSSDYHSIPGLRIITQK